MSTAPIDVEPLAYRPQAAAAALGVSKSRLYELVASGQIRARRLSPQVMVIPRAELERYIDAQRKRDR